MVNSKRKVLSSLDVEMEERQKNEILPSLVERQLHKPSETTIRDGI